MTDKKKPIDWPAIRSDWEKSEWSIRRIADWYQISDRLIRNKAKAEEWGPRPSAAPTKPIRAEARPIPPVVVPDFDPTDPEQIVGRGHNLIFRLLAELDATTTHGTELAEMIEAHEEDPRRRAAMLKAVDLSSRANVVKALALAFKTWNESKAPDGKKKAREAAAKDIAGSGSKFAARSGPRLAVVNK